MNDNLDGIENAVNRLNESLIRLESKLEGINLAPKPSISKSLLSTVFAFAKVRITTLILLAVIGYWGVGNLPNFVSNQFTTTREVIDFDLGKGIATIKNGEALETFHLSDGIWYNKTLDKVSDTLLDQLLKPNKTDLPKEKTLWLLQ